MFCKKSMLAAAAFASTFPVAPVGDSVFLVGAFADLSFLGAGSAAATGLSILLRWVPAAASIVAFALSETNVELAVVVALSSVLALSSLFLLCTSACLEVVPQRKKVFLRSTAVRLILLQTTIRVQVSTASSVACLWAWGRLPDGWTSLTMPRSQRQPHLKVLFVPGQVVRMRLGWPGPGKAKFSFFLKGHDGCTRVTKCHDGDPIHDVVGYVGWDIYATFRCHILDLSGVLLRVKVSLMMIPFGYLVDSVGDRITLTFLDTGSVLTVVQRVVGQYDAIATGAERPVLKLLLLLLLGILVGVEGVAKALLAGTLLLDLAVCRPRFGNHVSCLLVYRQVLGLEPHQKMLILLRYLEICLERSNFFRRSCLKKTSPSVRSWLLLLLKRKGPRNESSCSGKKCNLKTGCANQETGHVEQIAKLEADVAKQRAMLQSVREQLEAVNDEVCALRALVADLSVPTGPVPEPPPLPAPRTPPSPPSQDLLDIAQPIDQETGICEKEEELEWPPVSSFFSFRSA